MWYVLKKFLFTCFLALIVMGGTFFTGNAEAASPITIEKPLMLADAMQMTGEKHSHGHDGNMEEMESMNEDMSENESSHHRMDSKVAEPDAGHETHGHTMAQATETHEHQHDERTMGKPGEGPNWPLIEGFAFFNILVLIGAGFMKWKKKENVQ
jgi:hypothetical protein